MRCLTGTETDTLAEEQQRGLTINPGFAYSQEILDDNRHTPCVLGFVDVPGHRDFIHNMLAGVASIHAVLLVVAADDGIMPQTREHLSIIRLLGVAQAVVAITKTDLCDSSRLDTLRQDVKTLLADSPVADAEIIATSSKTGAGIEQIRQALLALATTNLQHSQRASDRYFRFQLDRCFSVRGIGTVVTGSTVAGSCAVDSTLLHSGSGTTIRVRGIRLHEQELPVTRAGDRAALALSGLTQEQVSRGDWLCDPRLAHPVSRFDAAVQWLEDKPPRSGAHYHLHLGAAHFLVSLRSLDASNNWFQIRSDLPIYCHYGDRFVIRDPTGQATVGGGHVVDIFIPRRHRASQARLQTLKSLDQADDLALQSLLASSDYGVPVMRFRLARNLNEQGLAGMLSTMKAQGSELVTVEDTNQQAYLFSRSRFEALSNRLLQCITEHHRQHRSERGMTEPQLSKSSDFGGPYALLIGIVQKLLHLKLIQRSGHSLHLPGHQAEESAEEKVLSETLRPILLAAGKIPPRTRELVEMTGIALPRLEAILKHCARSGHLVRVADNRYFLPETIHELAQFTEQLAGADEEDAGFSVIQFRDASGIGRNLCIEILEYFDRAGFTRREDNTRFVRTASENIFS